MRDEAKYTEDEIEQMFRKLQKNKLTILNLSEKLDLPIQEVSNAFNYSYSTGRTKHAIKRWMKGV